jgi:2-polyprenyl-6-methoxyphenol hydroxylase-like FAD-dependent oxidoreductase
MMKPRALVIGSSLGGLFAACMLRDIGWDVRIYERVEDDLASRGAGIGTHDELMNVIRGLGLAVDESIGVRVRQRICLDRGGRVAHEVALPQFMSAWARIYRLLKDALPADCCRFGTALERLEQDGSGITAVFADGTRASGELLVGADGLRSTVRAQLLPAAEPRYAGYVAWRGVADEWDIPPEVHAELFEKYTFCLPEGEMMLAYPVPGRDNDTRAGRRGYNFVWYRPTGEHDALPALCTDAAGRCHGQAIAPPLIRPEVIARMKAEARALLAPQIAGIVERTAQPFFQAIYDLESPRIAFGRAVLLGDAAFVARPHVGMGVTKAALDARCLADALRDCGDVDAALARYDRERRRFGSRIVARARSLGAWIEARSRPDDIRGAAAQQPPPEFVMREIGSSAVDIGALTAAARSTGSGI